MSFNVNDAPTLRCAFTVSAAAADPTTVSLAVRKPDGTTAFYSYGGGGTIAKDSVGDYSQQITVDQRGVWYYVWTGTGNCQAADEGTFRVSR